MLYPIVEKFISINGEGAHAGELAAFIRFKGCNLRCPYCDTKWAYDNNAAAEMLSAEQLCSFAQGIVNVTLTGGEPLLQDIGTLTDLLIENGHRVEIETNGSISIEQLALRKRRPFFTLDYKSPSSGMEDKMLAENYNYLVDGDCVKFVVGGQNDLDKACSVIEKYSLTEKCSVFLSPIFGNITAAEIVEYMKNKQLNRVRLQLQLHKYIWDPEKRGV